MNLSGLLNLPAARALAEARRNARNRDGRAGQQPQKPWYTVRNEKDSDEAEILIYDVIDPDPWFGGVSAQDFVRDLAAVEAKNLTVRINSPGGNVYDAIAITNALRNFDGTVTTVVDGMAASAASFIAIGGGDELVMSRNSELMIHDARGVCIGDATAMAEYADWLHRCSDNIAEIYAEKAGSDASEWRAAMTAETWYGADEAVAAGLADRVKEATKSDSTTTSNRFDLSVFAHAGRDAAPTPFIPAASAAVGPSRKEAPVATLKEGLAERLGIDADADDETTLAAIDEALAERANTESDEDGETPGLDQIQSAAAKLGLKVVNASQWDAVTQQASAGEQARAKQLADQREAVVNEAVRRGKIAPVQKGNFIALMEKDPAGTEKFLNELPDETAVPMSELGHATEPISGTEDTTRADALYKEWSL